MTTAVAAGPAGSVEAFERLMLEDIRAGRGFHQTATAPAGPLRARSVDVADSAHGGNVYEAYNAHLLHVQMRVRGVTNPEFVSRGQIDKLGGRRVGGEAGYWVAAGEKRAAHVGSTIKVSGDPYVVYHLDSQTSLASREQPCAAVKQGSERGLDAHVARVQKVAALSGVRVDFGKDDRCRVVSDGKSPRVLVPDFRSVSRAGLPGWSSAVMTAVASAVQGDRILRGQVEADAVEVGAVRSENRVRLRNNAKCRDRSEKLPRLALQGGDAAAWEDVRSTAAHHLYVLAAKEIARRSGMRIHWESKLGRAEYDAASRILQPVGRARYREPGKRGEAAFARGVMVGAAECSGISELVDAAQAWRDGRSDPAGYGVVRAAGVRSGSFSHPLSDLAPAEERAREALVGGIAARRACEELGIRFEPAPVSREDGSLQAAVAEREGLRSIHREAENTKHFLLDASRIWRPERQAEIAHSYDGDLAPGGRARARAHAAEEPGSPERPRVAPAARAVELSR